MQRSTPVMVDYSGSVEVHGDTVLGLSLVYALDDRDSFRQDAGTSPKEAGSHSTQHLEWIRILRTGHIPHPLYTIC